ncbi:MAG TPA: ABC transporter ATP-binding protein, partial [Emcibacteraceae bacterium]|nr:ABC transporter ATP-binding protein [Emcibacteraceae bacterium]
IVVGSIAAFLFKSLIKTARKSGIEMAEFLQALVIRLHEALLGAKPLKAMGQESRFLSLLEKDIFAVNKSKKRQLVSNLLLQAFQEPLLIVLISSGLYWAYTYANYPIAELLLIAFLFYRLISQIGQVQAHYQKSTNVEGAVRSILKSLHSAEENNEVTTGEKQPSYKKGISFSDVSLSYDDNLILDRFKDKILPHKLSVIFGPSGVGKSTLLDSILGFIKPSSGQILIDDTPLEQLDIKKWRQMIGYVPQETFLFHDTILQNITLGDHDISKDDVIKALKTSNAWEFVEQIEDGLNHIVGERGGKLSGGQKQRLALARALVRKPDILILDEATTGLDKESENAILSSLKDMLKDTTIIAISHDPKILDIADHVIHLDKKS